MTSRPTDHRTDTPPVASSSSHAGAIRLMALSTGVIIANLYYIQPLETVIAHSLHVSSSAIGVVTTLLQFGYATGLAFILPLGDRWDRRKLLTLLITGVVIGMAVMASAPNFPVFVVGAAVTGVCSVGVQVMVPFAAMLAAPGQQGKAVSTVISGLLIGVLLSRTVGGLLGQWLGWQSVFLVGAVVSGLLALVLYRALPHAEPATNLSYPRLLQSTFGLTVKYPTLRLRMAYGAVTFAAFSGFWTAVTFLLTGPHYGWKVSEVGLFALLGVAGALMAQAAGRLNDEGHTTLITGVGLFAMLASFLVMGFGQTSLIALAVGAIVMDMACQAVHISNQATIYPLEPESRSRLNAAYMVAYFIGGSAGSLLCTLVFHAVGWWGVCITCAALVAIGVALFLLNMRRPAASAIAAE